MNAKLIQQPTEKSLPEKELPAQTLTDFIFKAPKVDKNGTIIEWEEGRIRQEVINLPNNVTLEMVYIPAGEFLMGARQGEPETRNNTYPQRNVTVSNFYMAKYPITQEQYQAVMGENPSNFKGKKRPAEQVSWEDATSFCQKLSLLTETFYRLPTEAEWEYACRANTVTPFHFGVTITPELANYNSNYYYANAFKGPYREQTTEIGCFSPNLFGLHDMHGNVWEWCEDVWFENYKDAPSQTTAKIRGDEPLQRIVRGGSWYDGPLWLRSATRFKYSPASRYYVIGFRICRA